MEFASIFRSALKCPMTKTKKASKADSAGDEKAENSIATPGEVLSLPFLSGQLAVYQAELRSLKERTEALEEQPAPSVDAGTVLGKLTSV